MTTESLGALIRRLRKEKKLTLDQLAQLCGTSKSYLSELETGKKQRPSAYKLSIIAEHLEVPLQSLLAPLYKFPRRKVKFVHMTSNTDDTVDWVYTLDTQSRLWCWFSNTNQWTLRCEAPDEPEEIYFPGQKDCNQSQ